MKLAGNVILALAFSGLSLTAFAFDDPQSDYNSLYFTDSQTDLNETRVIDISALETVALTENVNVNERFVDPQSDYDSIHMTDYLESLER